MLNLNKKASIDAKCQYLLLGLKEIPTFVRNLPRKT
jgi:hypothetical protein